VAAELCRKNSIVKQSSRTDNWHPQLFIIVIYFFRWTTPDVGTMSNTWAKAL